MVKVLLKRALALSRVLSCGYLNLAVLSVSFFVCWAFCKEERWLGQCLEKGYIEGVGRKRTKLL